MGLVDVQTEGTVSIERISVALLLLLHGKRFAQG